MKVELLRERKAFLETLNCNRHLQRQDIVKSLPFFRSASGVYVHRVRSGAHHYTNGEYNHSTVRFWCGGGGFFGSKTRASKNRNGQFFSEIIGPMMLCATCEGKAIGAGMDGVREINGKKVLFQPRI